MPLPAQQTAADRPVAATADRPAAATAAQAAQAAAVTAPAQVVPAPPPPAAVRSGSPPPEATTRRYPLGARRRALSFRLPQLHIGWHQVTLATLRQLSAPTQSGGLILGVDEQRRPVPVRLFRPEPTRVTLVGGVWAQRLIALRALALGTRILVMTTDAAAWHGFGEWATGRSDRVILWTGPRPPVARATAQQPLLIVDDTGTYGSAPLPEPGPWQTELTVVRQVNSANVRAMQDRHLVILQRLAETEAPLAAPALGLAEPDAQFLTALAEDMLALRTGDTYRYLWIAPTDIERQYQGPPCR